MPASYDTDSKHFDEAMRLAKCPPRAETLAGIAAAVKRLWPIGLQSQPEGESGTHTGETE